MSLTTFRGGSGVSARAITPSLQLAKLVGQLARAISPPAGAADPLPLFSRDESRVVMNTRGVLGRLFANPEFRTESEPGPNSGFVRDIEMPPLGTDARVGGRLFAGSEVEMTKAVNSFVAAIDTQLADAVPVDLIPALAGRSIAQGRCPARC